MQIFNFNILRFHRSTFQATLKWGVASWIRDTTRRLRPWLGWRLGRRYFAFSTMRATAGSCSYLNHNFSIEHPRAFTLTNCDAETRSVGNTSSLVLQSRRTVNCALHIDDRRFRRVGGRQFSIFSWRRPRQSAHHHLQDCRPTIFDMKLTPFRPMSKKKGVNVCAITRK